MVQTPPHGLSRQKGVTHTMDEVEVPWSINCYCGITAAPKARDLPSWNCACGCEVGVKRNKEIASYVRQLHCTMASRQLSHLQSAPPSYTYPLWISHSEGSHNLPHKFCNHRHGALDFSWNVASLQGFP